MEQTKLIEDPNNLISMDEYRIIYSKQYRKEYRNNKRKLTIGNIISSDTISESPKEDNVELIPCLSDDLEIGNIISSDTISESPKEDNVELIPCLSDDLEIGNIISSDTISGDNNFELLINKLEDDFTQLIRYIRKNHKK